MHHGRRAGKRKKLRRRLLIAETVLAVSLAALVSFALEETEQRGMVTVSFRGVPFQAASGETVGQLLKQLGLEPGAEDVLSMPEDAVLEDGMVLRIDRVQRRQETYTTVLPAQTVYCRDSSLPIGTEKLLEPGEDGQLRCSAEVVYRNGLEQSRWVTERELLCAPTDRVVAVGDRTEETPEIRNGWIRLHDGRMLTYTHTAVVHASAYPGPVTGQVTLAGDSTLRIGTIAADPARIPPGTRLYVAAADGSVFYGIAVAVAGMQGDRVELYFPTAAECMEFGQRACVAYFLGSC